MAKINISDYTGAVNVNGDVTPTTREKIEKVTPEKWLEMDINQLWDQRVILNNRMIKAFQSGNANIGIQINKGILKLDAILQHKSEEETNNETGLI